MIDAVELRLIRMPLVRPFRTSFGVEGAKECVLVRVIAADGEGWGECVAGPEPGYSEEFNDEVWLTMQEHLIPPLLGGDAAPEGLVKGFGHVRGHRMAKAALEMAVLDAHLRARGVSLREHLGGERDRVAVGVSIGIQPTIDELVEQAASWIDAGYRRVKLKIEPGSDVEPVSAVRRAFPDVPLSVDANASYSLEDIGVFRELDTFELMMIEQPLSHEDLAQHAKLQRELDTAICLDESIRSAADARSALEMGACRIVNVKQGRVGGLLEARRVHDVALEAGVPVWCGGMLETGLGRAANLALASLPGFTLPGDISASARYFPEDLTAPFEVAPDGTMGVPTGAGLGVQPLPERLNDVTERVELFEKE